MASYGIKYDGYLKQSGFEKLVADTQGKRILFLECLLDKGFGHYLVLLLKCETLTRQGLWDLDAFVLS